MELKTKITATDGKQEIFIEREFDIPLNLLFKAYTDAEIICQWMGTNVLKLENKQHGGYQFETRNKNGDVVFKAHGSIHDIIPDQMIIRTFQMQNTPFPAQIEFLTFEKIRDDKSKIAIQTIYKSLEIRDQMLKLPFAQGINMAHNRLEEIILLSI
ncbi:SRPBCC domain-containing protein [Chryseobacterium salviniae]|uniref:SRPBCC domain-containing protein n=1 Tax=Chryseobacterium salviniae TaxID=3101750 RepID=A0ABU6HUW7_9FLAO|nr:SRPBCC domain-containing protein [Chryseobacterium sp. T9W2-O]MEC3876203.1 SRPBCC domain-containing protein [Chryseobacterium sp. T9W2-O]